MGCQVQRTNRISVLVEKSTPPIGSEAVGHGGEDLVTIDATRR